MFAADAGDYSGCYETYLAAANEIVQHSNDEDIRGILNKAMADVLQLSNPTEQAEGSEAAGRDVVLLQPAQGGPEPPSPCGGTVFWLTHPPLGPRPGGGRGS